MTKIPQLLVLVLVVSSFAAALSHSAADSNGVSSLVGPSNGGSTPEGESGKSVLIYGPSLGALVPPMWEHNEETLATLLGHAVTVADANTWSGLTAEEFGAFDAIVFGDPKCGVGRGILLEAYTNRAVWSSVITGPTIVVGTTPQLIDHNPNLNHHELTSNGIDFATSGPGTGLYVSLSCYYIDVPQNTEVEFLSAVGDFRVGGREGCTGAVTIVDPNHPGMAGLTSVGIPDWMCSSQEFISSFPASLNVLATAVRPSDGADIPFIVATPYEAPADPPADDPEFDEFWAEIEVEDDEYEVEGGFTLGAESDGIDPLNEDLTLRIGTHSLTIPAGSFSLDDDEFEFEGVVDGVALEVEISPSDTDKHIRKHLRKAIGHLERSLDPRLWVDDSHLEEEHGSKVFNKERKAVNHLIHVLKDRRIGLAVAEAIATAIEEIVRSDRLLAETVLQDAKATAADNPRDQKRADRQIEKAEKDLARALRDLERGRPDKAIEHYKHAWKHAMRAIEHVGADWQEGPIAIDEIKATTISTLRELSGTLLGDNTFEFELEVEGASLDGLGNPVEISLTIGDDSGTTTATADDCDDEKDDED